MQIHLSKKKTVKSSSLTLFSRTRKRIFKLYLVPEIIKAKICYKNIILTNNLELKCQIA